MPDIQTFASPADLADAAAGALIEAVNTYPEHRFNLALSGGSTPPMIFQRLEARRAEFDPRRLRLFWIDERCVALDDPDSNAGSAKNNMPSVWEAAEVHIMDGAGDPAKAAAVYEALLRDHGGADAFDLALIGVGPDGHVASLFPNESEPEDGALAIASRNPAGQDRLSVTYPVLLACDRQLVVACGASKAPAIRQACDGTVPAGQQLLPFARACATHANSTFLIDEACAQAAGLG